MFSTLPDINQYGGYTHEIKFMPFLLFRLTEISPTTIIVTLIETSIFKKDKIHFEFTVNGSVIDATIAAFSKIKFAPMFDMRKVDAIQDKLDLELVKKAEQIKEKSIIIKQGV